MSNTNPTILGDLAAALAANGFDGLPLTLPVLYRDPTGNVYATESIAVETHRGKDVVMVSIQPHVEPVTMTLGDIEAFLGNHPNVAPPSDVKRLLRALYIEAGASVPAHLTGN